MAKPEKTLCEWSKKDIREKLGELRNLVDAPKAYCTRCARVANAKQYLCKPKSL